MHRVGFFGWVAVCWLSFVGLASAHPVVVDGVTTDWSARLPNAANLGLVARDATGGGEYVWRDADADQRTDVAGTSAVDLAIFRVTADATNLYFLVTTNASMTPALVPQLQIAIDTDLVSTSGQPFLAGFADTLTSDDARWERIVQTRFGTTGDAHVMDASFGHVADLSAAIGPTGAVEIAVPWTALGFTGPPSTPLRFTVATFFSNAGSDDTVNLGDSSVSNAFDVVTDYGDPRATAYPGTWDELMDADIDYSPDLWFASSGDVRAPVAITRFVYDVVGTEPNAEWVAITNVSGAALNLADYKIGDEETPDGGEGMGRFPSATIGSGSSFVIANRGTDYLARYGELPDAELTNLTSAADVTVFAAWAGGSINLANGGDEILLLDRWNTAIDIATYLAGVYSGITSFPVAGAADDERVIERVVASSDTDNCAVDFVARGRACADSSQCGAVACNECVVNTCQRAPAGTSCVDANVCNGSETCNATGACTAGTPLTCADGNPCTADACDAIAGCQFTPVSAGTSCADGTVCNGAETCDASGACTPGSPLGCDDGNPCTADSCDAVAGCQHTPVSAGTSCSDGNACNGAETCDAAGACGAGTALVCNDGNPCTTDSCSPASGCVATPVSTGTSCSDGNLCNGAETCNASGTCVAGTALSCADTNPCTTDSCVPATGCAHTPAPVGTSCADTNLCNGAETCNATGTCSAGTALVCNDGNPCTSDSCVAATGCTTTNVAAGTLCNDANACNGNETCNGSGVCSAGTPLACNDGNPCTADTCVPATGCGATPVAAGTSCADADLCDGTETCNASGSCVAGSALSCADTNPCTDDSCSPATGCVHANNTATCDDGQFCTISDRCAAGACAGTARDCGDTNPCTVDSCDDAADACAHDATPLEGTTCNDGQFCTVGDTCMVGACTGMTNPCSDSETCTADSCDETMDACAHASVADGTTCASAGGCTTGGTCAGGACSAVTPEPSGTACDDEDACTSGDACDDMGMCLPGATSACDDENPCTVDSCDAVAGCAHDATGADGTACDDGDACTEGDVCASGECMSGASTPDCADGGMPDAGSGDAGPRDAGGRSDASPPRDGAPSDGARPDGSTPAAADDGGCGCTVPGAASATRPAALALAVGAWLLAASRRRRRRAKGRKQ